ncbi:MAG: hypothetical protein HQM00_06035 [Magnetococcales bacterium]|nr:hypothetical protein [Magnetococcales bacterium]
MSGSPDPSLAGEKKYPFEKWLPMGLAGLLIGVGGIVEGIQLANGHLEFGAYRFFYFNLLIVLCAGAWFGARSGRHRLAWWILAFVVIDLTFGVVTHKLSRAGPGRSFLPENHLQSRFQYHPLLQAVPTPGYRDRRHEHDERGLRRSLPVNRQRPSIAVFGGSTTYDIGVRNRETWPERLEESLHGAANVLNFGVPGYSTAEHLIQTAFYLDPQRDRLRCAIYYVGWNDIRNSFLPKLDPGYADFHLPSQIDNLDARRRSFLHSFSLGVLLDRMLHLQFDSLPGAPDYRREPEGSGVDARLMELYRRNVGNIARLAHDRGVRVLFVAQLLNEGRLSGEGRYGWLPMVRDREVPVIQEAFNQALVETGREQGFEVLRIGSGVFEDRDFVDNGHFSVEGARKFASRLEGWSRNHCLE